MSTPPSPDLLSRLDWDHFTPLASLAGGALLGLAAVVMLLGAGRILGISGIVGGLISPLVRGRLVQGGAVPGSQPAHELWRIAFAAGLLAAPLAHGLLGDFLLGQGSTSLTERIDTGWTGVVAAGLMVGVGTRYGAGCTSGHGVCGLSRGSPRSVAATAAFMGAGFVTVYLMRHLLA